MRDNRDGTIDGSDAAICAPASLPDGLVMPTSRRLPLPPGESQILLDIITKFRLLNSEFRTQSSAMALLTLHPSLVDQAYDAILGEIADGTLAPNTHLVQEVLAARYGV